MIEVRDVEKLAELARIKLDDAEKQSLTKDIASILTYVDEIKKADVDMETMPHVGVVHNVMRDDVVVERGGAEREALLAEAPDREGDFIAVKKIIAQD